MYQDQHSQQKGMNQPPRVLSTKDSAYLTDALSWELLAAKKAYSFATQCSDQQVKHQLEQISQLHHAHYHTLLNHLSTNQQDQYFDHQQYQN